MIYSVLLAVDFRTDSFDIAGMEFVAGSDRMLIVKQKILENVDDKGEIFPQQNHRGWLFPSSVQFSFS